MQMRTLRHVAIAAFAVLFVLLFIRAQVALGDKDQDTGPRYLEGNDLTGCIPSGLRDIANNDLDQFDLQFCSQ